MGKTPISIPMLHQNYSDAAEAFLRTLKSTALRLAVRQELDPSMRASAAGIWAREGGITPRHVEAVNAIYTRGNPVPDCLYWELSSLAGESGGAPPAFFYRLVREEGDAARRFIDFYSIMLTLFAAVDGRVTEAETAYVSECEKRLTELLNQQDPQAPPPEGDPAGPAGKAEQDSGSAGPASASAPAEPKAGKPEETPPPDLPGLLRELDGLCGLTKVKKDVKSLIHLVQVRKMREENHLPVLPMSLHMVFLGGPGTGKTTVARLLAQIYRAVGVLTQGQLVEVDRSGLVAGYVGQTALKTGEAVKRALGGILFIDEAYALTRSENGNDFGQEAIEVLLKSMEDHRDDFIVIVAGYTELMDDFIASNPGLKSRFNKYFFFEDYNGAQLFEIFLALCEKNGYRPDEAAREYAKTLFETLYQNRDENFGNARDVRNLFEKAVSRQSDRLATAESPSRDDLMALTAEDLKGAAEDGEGDNRI